MKPEPKYNMHETLMTLAEMVDHLIKEHQAYVEFFDKAGLVDHNNFFARSAGIFEQVLPYIEGLSSIPLVSAPYAEGQTLVGVVIEDDHGGVPLSPAWCLTCFSGMLLAQTQEIPPETDTDVG